MWYAIHYWLHAKLNWFLKYWLKYNNNPLLSQIVEWYSSKITRKPILWKEAFSISNMKKLSLDIIRKRNSYCFWLPHLYLMSLFAVFKWTKVISQNRTHWITLKALKVWKQLIVFIFYPEEKAKRKNNIEHKQYRRNTSNIRRNRSSIIVNKKHS